MSNNQIPMTATIPSGFAMPTSVEVPASTRGALGTDLGMATVAGCAPVFTAAVRERHVAGDAIAQPYPGPTAWSPPPS